MIQTPNLAVECLRNAQQSTDLPVSVKTRLGWSNPEEYKTWLPILLAEHPAALTVHLRTKKEMSKVPAHYELIPEIIKLRDQISPETKLIINGDIKDKAHALELHTKYPEIDGFMIGRGVFANPYCFTDHTPTKEELMELLKMHLNLYEKYAIPTNIEEHKNQTATGGLAAEGAELPKYCKNCKPRYIPYEPLKHFFKIYVNNFPGAKELRAKLMETHSAPEARAVIENL